MNEADVTKKRLAIEKADLEKQLNDGENALRNLSKLRTSLSTQVCSKLGVSVILKGVYLNYSLYCHV